MKEKAWKPHRNLIKICVKLCQNIYSSDIFAEFENGGKLLKKITTRGGKLSLYGCSESLVTRKKSHLVQYSSNLLWRFVQRYNGRVKKGSILLPNLAAIHVSLYSLIETLWTLMKSRFLPSLNASNSKGLL